MPGQGKPGRDGTPQTMTRKQAADYLNCSEKTISRYVSAGRLTAQYIHGKTGQQLDIEQGELDRLQEELNTPQVRGIEVERQAGTSRALVPTTPAPIANPVTLAQLQKLLEQGTGQDKTRRTRPVVPISELKFLSVDEARALLGAVPLATIKAAMQSGDLPAKKLGGRWAIRRGDLDKWADTI